MYRQHLNITHTIGMNAYKHCSLFLFLLNEGGGAGGWLWKEILLIGRLFKCYKVSMPEYTSSGAWNSCAGVCGTSRTIPLNSKKRKKEREKHTRNKPIHQNFCFVWCLILHESFIISSSSFIPPPHPCMRGGSHWLCVEMRGNSNPFGMLNWPSLLSVSFFFHVCLSQVRKRGWGLW